MAIIAIIGKINYLQAFILAIIGAVGHHWWPSLAFFFTREATTKPAPTPQAAEVDEGILCLFDIYP
jgi:hypothetical protein